MYSSTHRSCGLVHVQELEAQEQINCAVGARGAKHTDTFVLVQFLQFSTFLDTSGFRTQATCPYVYPQFSSRR